jgi:hypothetical protein
MRVDVRDLSALLLLAYLFVPADPRGVERAVPEWSGATTTRQVFVVMERDLLRGAVRKLADGLNLPAR